METLAIRNLSFSYPEQRTCALSGVDLSVNSGDFVVLCGPSGCGKSTLLRQLKPVLAPHGRREGEILFQGQPLDTLDWAAQTRQIGFVGQSPENQIVTDKVWHELAFGLESLGCDTPTIRRRVAEMASFFGIEAWFYRDVSALSGGQKQLLNLASVMVMQPSLLILDEPTGQLDPIAAQEFLSVLGKLNRELGVTILLAEHRLEEAIPLATAVAVMDGGRILCSGPADEVGNTIKNMGHPMFQGMPAAMRIWAGCESSAPCPVTVRDGRAWLETYAAGHSLEALPEENIPAPSEEIIRGEGLWFKYEKDMSNVLKGITLSVRKGELLALMGGNGAGKTTFLRLIAGTLRPYRGRLAVRGRVGMLPQDPRTLFVKKTVREDLLETAGPAERFAQVVALCRLEALLNRHPYDLSGGEQQRAALAKVLLTFPDILLLDEPTKGLDAAFKQTLGELLQALTRMGVTVILVSHDVEFCARYACRCALLFDGSIVSEGTPRIFFSGNSFYTTSANRMARAFLPEAVTVEDVICSCGGTPPQTAPLPKPAENAPEHWAAEQPPTVPKRHGPGKRAVAPVMVLLLIPLTLLAGHYYLGGRKYALISCLILLESMLPFFLMFEGRKPQARELAVIATLCAIGVAGRAVFFMLPQFKPVIAIVIIAGAAFGGETGFLVGTMTMLVSNLLFSQGPWTPWQMLAAGLIGFLAGVLSRKGLLRRTRLSLSVFGALASILVYGGIMNLSSALLWVEELDWQILLSYYVTGFPMDCVLAASTFLFLWFATAPFLEKLDRIKTKYGLVESRP